MLFTKYYKINEHNLASVCETRDGYEKNKILRLEKLVKRNSLRDRCSWEHAVTQNS